MEGSRALDQARSFVCLILDDEVPTLELLARGLDELVLSYHAAANGSPAESELEPELGDWQQRYSIIGRRFPELGYYGVADPTIVAEGKPPVGDAIDDLADIVRDLEEVLWRREHLGIDDAHWHFRLLFEIHWGRHARELALYLHSQRFG